MIGIYWHKNEAGTCFGERSAVVQVAPVDELRQHAINGEAKKASPSQGGREVLACLCAQSRLGCRNDLLRAVVCQRQLREVTNACNVSLEYGGTARKDVCRAGKGMSAGG